MAALSSIRIWFVAGLAKPRYAPPKSATADWTLASVAACAAVSPVADHRVAASATTVFNMST